MKLHVGILVSLVTAGCVVDDDPTLGTAEQDLVVDPGDLGWAWANQPSSAAYTPDPAYSYNNRGGAISITRLSTGRYQVDFEAMSTGFAPTLWGGHAQAVAYGASATRCKLETFSTWSTIARVSVFVRCHDTAGAAIDSQFVVWYSEGHGAGAHLLSASSGQPHWAYTYNSTGGSNVVTRSATGRYLVRLGGLTDVTGHVLVTAFGTNANHCKPVWWGTDSAYPNDTSVEVRCFDTAGAAADSRFTLRYIVDDTVVGYPGAWMGYSWMDQAALASYTPNGLWRFNTVGGNNTAARSAVGTYADTFPDVPTADSTVLTTSYENNATYCKVRSWTGVSNLTANIECYSATGVKVDARHNTLVMSPKPAGPSCETVCFPDHCESTCF